MIIHFVNVETDPRLRYHATHLPQQKCKTTISLWMFIFLLFWMKAIWDEGGDGVIWHKTPLKTEVVNSQHHRDMT
jgi:hypothetical protein